MEDLIKLQENLFYAVSILGNKESIEDFRKIVLGKDGVITNQMKTLGSYDPEERVRRGQKLNLIKEEFEQALENRKKELSVPLTQAQEDVLEAAKAYAEAESLWSPLAQAQPQDSDWDMANRRRASMESAKNHLLFITRKLLT